MYYALIYSHPYGPVSLSSTSSFNIKKSALCKKAKCTITFSKFNAHTGPLFKEIEILPLDKILSEAKLTFMHSYVYGTFPPPVQNTWLTNADRGGIPNLRNNSLSKYYSS